METGVQRTHGTHLSRAGNAEGLFVSPRGHGGNELTVVCRFLRSQRKGGFLRSVL